MKLITWDTQWGGGGQIPCPNERTPMIIRSLSCKTLLSAFLSLIWHQGQKVLEANQVSVPPQSSVHFT